MNQKGSIKSKSKIIEALIWMLNGAYFFWAFKVYQMKFSSLLNFESFLKPNKIIFLSIKIFNLNIAFLFFLAHWAIFLQCDLRSRVTNQKYYHGLNII